MRKLAESTLVMLDDVTQAPERRASFDDAESTAYSAERPKPSTFVTVRVTSRSSQVNLTEATSPIRLIATRARRRPRL